MNLKSFKTFAVAWSLAFLGLGIPVPGRAQTAASVTVNAGTTLTSLISIKLTFRV